MKRFLALLLCLIIFVSPVLQSAKAVAVVDDAVIGFAAICLVGCGLVFNAQGGIDGLREITDGFLKSSSSALDWARSQSALAVDGVIRLGQSFYDGIQSFLGDATSYFADSSVTVTGVSLSSLFPVSLVDGQQFTVTLVSDSTKSYSVVRSADICSLYNAYTGDLLSVVSPPYDGYSIKSSSWDYSSAFTVVYANETGREYYRSLNFPPNIFVDSSIVDLSFSDSKFDNITFSALSSAEVLTGFGQVADIPEDDTQKPALPLPPLGDLLGKTAPDIWDTISSVDVPSIPDIPVDTVLGDILSGIKSIPDLIVNGLSNVFGWLQGLLQGIWESIKAIPQNIIGGFSWLRDMLQGIWDDVKSISETLVDGIVDGIVSAFDWLRGLLQSILDAILALPVRIAQAFLDLLLSLFVPSSNFWRNSFNDLMIVLSDKFGSDVVNSFYNQIKSVSSGSLDNVVLTLFGVEITIIDWSYLLKYRETYYKWIRGFAFITLFLANINNIYKLIRRNDLLGRGRGGY